MVANNGGALVSSVSSARHEGAPLAGRSMDGQWSTGGGGWRIVSTVSPAVFRLFTAVHGGAGAFCWGSSNRAPRLLLPRPSSSAFRFPGCGVIRRCYSWLTGCWNLSTRRPWSSNLLATQFHAEILLISYQEECGWAWKGEEVGGFSFLEELFGSRIGG